VNFKTIRKIIFKERFHSTTQTSSVSSETFKSILFSEIYVKQVHKEIPRKHLVLLLHKVHEHGRQKDFSRGAMMDFPGGGQKNIFSCSWVTVVNFHLTNSKLRGKYFCTKTLIPVVLHSISPDKQRPLNYRRRKCKFSECQAPAQT